ncbi:PPC domain-containing protein [Salinarchaeum sp. Harcht-Bsk1]|uniref:PPC domain-containing protein n=1 Tax=Salinarchaeum sp. Harcht-Bsk1 TaxID=1333523 RepID=UPI001181BB5D|nr:PPC domain-containing protein [Salinarchaeum sp. Harcht-Bsk1]
MQRKLLTLGAVIVLVTMAGCSGGILGGGGGSGTPDWCHQNAFQELSASGGEMNENVSASVQGMTDREGNDVCQVRYEAPSDSNSMYQRVDLFYNEDQSYVVMVYYDSHGNQVGEVDLSGMVGGTDSGGTTDDSTGGTTDDGTDSTTGDSTGGTTDDSTGGTSDDGDSTTDNSNPSPVVGTLSYGQTVNAELTEDDGVAGEWRDANADAYEFQGSAGDSVVISMTSDPVDTYLILEGPNGERVAVNDDNGYSLDSEINYTLQQSGTYTIWATTFTLDNYAGGEGPYTLTLEQQ